MVNAITLHGFSDLGHLVTPIFLSMVHFLYRFSTFCKKMRRIYWVEVWIFCKTFHQIPFIIIWPLHLAVLQLQMPLKGLRFVKMMAIFEIINATDSLIQNIIRIVCLCWLLFEFGNHTEYWILWRPCWITHDHPKGGNLRLLELNKLEVFERNWWAYIYTTTKCQMDSSVRVLNSLKHVV